MLAGKQLGMRRAYKQVAALVEKNRPDRRYLVYFIYSSDKKNCVGFVQYLQREGIDIGAPKYRGIGPTIASHIGPGTFGIVYVKEVENRLREV